MNENDSLKQLMTEFFNLPAGTPVAELTQKSVPKWDSLAMVQLIAELQSAYNVQFGIEEIEHLGSYAEIRTALLRKNVSLT